MDQFSWIPKILHIRREVISCISYTYKRKYGYTNLLIRENDDFQLCIYFKKKNIVSRIHNIRTKYVVSFYANVNLSLMRLASNNRESAII